MPIPASATRPSSGSWAPSGCDILDFETRADCEDDDQLATLENARGVFLTGGNQLRLATTLGGTSVARALRRLNAAGVHVAGTSAGAAFLSEHMIAIGEEGATPHSGDVTLSPGLGLTNRVVIDQHFRQRDRLGRLLTALAYNPFAVGLGLDEDTAAFIGPDDTLEVVGSGAITIIDPAEVEYSSMDQAEKGDPICLIGGAAPRPRARRRLRSPPTKGARPAGRHRPGLTPRGLSPMRILDRSVYVGPSVYALFPVIRLEVDLGKLEEWPSSRLGTRFIERPAGAAARPAGARLLLRRARAASCGGSPRTRAPGWATSSSTWPSSCRRSPAST